MIDKLPSTKGAFVGITGSMGSTDIVFKILVLKINEIIDHLNATEEENNSLDDKSEADEVRPLKVIRQAKDETEKLISLYNLEGKVNFYAKDIRGRGRRVTCVIKANTWSPYAVGRAMCSLSDRFYLYIGQIIALRRALGLAVPYEYTRMPQQKEDDKG